MCRTGGRDFVQLRMNSQIDLVGGVARRQIIVDHRTKARNITTAASVCWQMEVFGGHPCGQAGIVLRRNRCVADCGGCCWARALAGYQQRAEKSDGYAAQCERRRVHFAMSLNFHEVYLDAVDSLRQGIPQRRCSCIL